MRVRIFLTVVFSLCLFGLSRAQNKKAFLAGKSATLLNQYKKKTVKSLIDLKVSDSQVFKGKINFRNNAGTTNDAIVGELENIPGSSFRLNLSGNKVEGNIILRDKKKAYRYSTDASGNAVVDEVNINDVLCVDFNKYEEEVTYNKTEETTSSQVLTLESFPGAKGCILLDFDGQYVSGTQWNSGNPIDAAASGMTDTQIQQAWEVVSEDYKPFSINITTNEAVFNTYAKSKRRRCIITPTNTAAPGSGGVAYIGSFKNNDDTPCWVFILSGKNTGEAASHEIGHTLGLSHDGRTSPVEEYYGGQGSWAPIMGVSYSKTITQWSKGEYAAAKTTEDDLAKMASTTYGLGYRTDDFGNTISVAKALTVDAAGNVASDLNKGIIERTTDLDMFSFTTTGGTVALNFNTAARYADLDILAKLYDASGALLKTYNPAGLPASMNEILAAGKYYISIDGTGAGDPATTGYSEYASLGTYSISGKIPVTVNQLPEVSIAYPLNNATFSAPANIIISANASDKDGAISKVEFYMGSTKLGEDISSPYSLNWTNVATGKYTLTAKATDNSGAVVTSSAIIVNVVNEAPEVVIINPLANASFISPQSIAIEADASDSDGKIVKVEFYSNDTLIGSSTVSPYTFNWTKIKPGKYALKAKAIDNLGLATTSSSISITVLQNTAPTVTIVSPTANTSLSLSNEVTIKADITDKDGIIALVEFFADNKKIGELNALPYSFLWTDIAPGTYLIKVKATDNLGLVTISEVTLSVGLTTSLNASLPFGYFKIFPNPAKDFVTVEGAVEELSGSISIIDIFGKQVKEVLLSEPSSRVDISELPSGIYFFDFNNGKQSFRKRVVKF